MNRAFPQLEGLFISNLLTLARKTNFVLVTLHFVILFLCTKQDL